MKVVLAADLPANPSLEQLRKQAKDFRDGVRAGDAGCVGDVHELHPRPADAAAAGWDAFSLSDAQLVVARFYEFASWRRLREHLDVVARYSRSTRPPTRQDDLAAEFLRLACLTYRPGWGTDEDADDLRRHARARDLLDRAPGSLRRRHLYGGGRWRRGGRPFVPPRGRVTRGHRRRPVRLAASALPGIVPGEQS